MTTEQWAASGAGPDLITTLRHDPTRSAHDGPDSTSSIRSRDKSVIGILARPGSAQVGRAASRNSVMPPRVSFSVSTSPLRRDDTQRCSPSHSKAPTTSAVLAMSTPLVSSVFAAVVSSAVVSMPSAASSSRRPLLIDYTFTPPCCTAGLPSTRSIAPFAPLGSVMCGCAGSDLPLRIAAPLRPTAPATPTPLPFSFTAAGVGRSRRSRSLARAGLRSRSDAR